MKEIIKTKYNIFQEMELNYGVRKMEINGYILEKMDISLVKNGLNKLKQLEIKGLKS